MGEPYAILVRYLPEWLIALAALVCWRVGLRGVRNGYWHGVIMAILISGYAALYTWMWLAQPDNVARQAVIRLWLLIFFGGICLVVWVDTGRWRLGGKSVGGN
jgi:hypothetical protein